MRSAGNPVERQDTPKSARIDGGAGFPDQQERRLLYQELVDAVHRYHFYGAQTASNLGLDWEDSLKRLEAVFVEAKTPAALRAAIYRFSCSLHDAHLGYEPGVEGEGLELGLTLDGAYRDGRAEFRVRAVTDAGLKGRVQSGDILVAADGIKAAELSRVYLDRTSANDWLSVTRAVARFLTRRRTEIDTTSAGDLAHFRFRRPGVQAASELDVELHWQKIVSHQDPAESLRTEPDYAPAACRPYSGEILPALAERHYDSPERPRDGYRVSGYGRNFCLYTAQRPPYRDYPIVRHYSFFYYARFPQNQADDAALNNEATYAVAAEYFALSRLLRAQKSVRGLILDLRDNGGGNDPDWFLDWYAPAAYEDVYESIRVDPQRQDPQFVAAVSNLSEKWLKWYELASVGLRPGTVLKRPFKCLREDCRGGNRFTPARALLSVPVVLLVGPDCRSSCAHFVHVFKENRFGALIGEPTSATLTDQVYAYPVRTRSGLLLGRIGLAVSETHSARGGAALEGATYTVDYPVPWTFEAQAGWDAAHVAAALRAFHEVSFPPQVTPLGP